ncbi:hypothetical protein V3481_011797 [Fusarium oxysporum f. sp. vasinfectum]
MGSPSRVESSQAQVSSARIYSTSISTSTSISISSRLSYCLIFTVCITNILPPCFLCFISLSQSQSQSQSYHQRLARLLFFETKTDNDLHAPLFGTYIYSLRLFPWPNSLDSFPLLLPSFPAPTYVHVQSVFSWDYA